MLCDLDNQFTFLTWSVLTLCEWLVVWPIIWKEEVRLVNTATKLSEFGKQAEEGFQRK